MDVEFAIKVLGGISAAIAISERFYTYSRKIYLKLKSESHCLKRQSARSNPPNLGINCQLKTKKSHIFYILECRNNFATQLSF